MTRDFNSLLAKHMNNMNDLTIAFREVLPSDAAMLLDWRASSRVNHFMATDVVPNSSQQEKWLRDCYERDDYYHWIYMMDGVDAGLINLAAYDRNVGVCSWGYYLGEERFLGKGGKVPPYFYRWVFEVLGVRELFTECFEDNPQVLSLYEGYGFRRAPELDRAVIKQRGECRLLGLRMDAERWKSHARGHDRADFPVKAWKNSPAHIRARY